MNLNRVPKVLVTNVTGANTGTTLATIVDGDMLVMNSIMGNMTGTPTPGSAANQEAIYIVQGKTTTGTFKLSHKIIAANVTSWKKLVYQAAVEQYAYIGYNTSGNALAAEDGTAMRLRLVVKDQHRFLPHRQTSFEYYYTTGAVADQYAMANDFAKKINADSRTLRAKFEAEVTSNGTVTELGMNATVTNGSDVVLAASAHSLSVGQYLRITDTPDGRDTIYKIKAVPSTVLITLDRKFTGTGRLINVGATTDDIGVLTVITSYGIRIRSKAITTRTTGSAPLDSYQQLQWSANISPINGDQGDEETVTNTAAVPAQGTFDTIRDLEFAASGYMGNTNKVLFPVDSFTPISDSTGNYDVYVIEHFSEIITGHGDSRDFLTTLLVFESSTSTKMDAIEAIIDAWMVGAGLPAIA